MLKTRPSANPIGKFVQFISPLLVVSIILAGVIPVSGAGLSKSLVESEPVSVEKSIASDLQASDSQWSDFDPAEQASLSTMLAEARYHYTWHTPSQAYTAPNPAQGFDLQLNSAGLHVTSAAPDLDWQLTQRLTGYPSAPEVHNQAAQAALDWQGGASETFENTPQGLRYSLQAEQLPVSAPDQMPSFSIQVGTDLLPGLNPSGSQLILRDASGAARLRYELVSALDAQGKLLPVRFELGGETPTNPDAFLLTISVLAEHPAAPLSITALIYSEQAILSASDAAQGDGFGYNVSLDSDTVVVGAPFASPGGASNLGSAYVFTRNQGAAEAWGQVVKLIPSLGAAGDQFGRSVAVDGDWIAVGAPFDSIGIGTNSGTVYLYYRNQGGAEAWGEVTRIYPADFVSNDYFGFSLALDGDTLAVGVYLDDDAAGADQGSVYLFSRNQGGANAWGQVTKIYAADAAAGDQFGFSLDLNNDHVVVGAPFADGAAGADQGAAYLFARNQGGADAWGQAAKLTSAAPAAGDLFGYAASLFNDTVVVGAPLRDGSAGLNQGAAYVFRFRQGLLNTWEQLAELTGSLVSGGDEFGGAVSVSQDIIVVGAPKDSGPLSQYQGAAYLFERNQGGSDAWGETQRLSGSVATGNDSFGFSVDASGRALVAGAYLHDGAAGIDQGSAFVFTAPVLSWGELGAFSPADAAAGDQFAAAVTLFGDTLVVGAPSDDGPAGADQGAAYLFYRSQNGVDAWGQVVKLTASDAAAGDAFGSSLALCYNKLVVGAPMDDGAAGADQGSAYLFYRNQSGLDAWGQLKKITAVDASSGDQFGRAVSLSADRLAVGAPQDDGAAGIDQGSVYLFSRNQGGADNWGQVTAVTASDAAAGDHFGAALSLGPDALVVGAPLDDGIAGVDQGAVYLYYRNSGGSDAWGEHLKVTASGGAASARFGSAVALNQRTLLVGAPFDDGAAGADQGSAYLFFRNQDGADNWGQVLRLTAADAAAGDRFGAAAALDEGLALVGASHKDGPLGSMQGAAYLYERNQGGADAWGQFDKLISGQNDDSDHFGSAVAIYSDVIAIGAPDFDGTAGIDQGQLHLFGFADQAPIATDNVYGVNENQVRAGNLISDNTGAGIDFDPEGGPLTLVAVDGDAGLVGVTTSLPSGALLTVQASGDFSYDPRPSALYNALAVGETALESFTYTITDAQNLSAIAGVEITIYGVNDTPQIAAGDLTLSANQINENAAVTLDGVFNDPDLTDDHTVTILWGDGEQDVLALAAGVSEFSQSHTYLDDDPSGTPADIYTITVTVSDGLASDQDTLNLTVNNLPPVLSGVSGDFDDINSTLTLSGLISDASALDSFTLQVDWGDGSDSTYTYAAGTSSFSETHLYQDLDPTGGIYLVSLILTDDDTGSDSSSLIVFLWDQVFPLHLPLMLRQ